MTGKFFFGGITSSGFSTQLRQIVSSKEYYTYILKGAPGTGKSQMMNKVADRFAQSENVTRFYCTSDPDSLDAVMLHSSKVVVLDGTPPHEFEPQYSGICQEVVNLGQCWDKAALEENRKAIIKTSELNKSMMAGAAAYSKALGLICDDTYACAERFANIQAIEESAQSFCANLFGNSEKDAGKGKRAIRQLSAMTRYGYTTLQESLGSCRQLYILDDGMFAASSMFLDCAAHQAREHGYDTVLSPCLLSERSFCEHLLIDEVGVAVMASTPLTQIAYAGAEHIDCSTYYDTEQLQAYKKHVATNQASINTLADASREMLDDAKRIHDEVERYYTSAMDFDALDSICERICKEIEDRGHQ